MSPARKTIRRLSRPDQERILAALAGLPSSGDVRPLVADPEHKWRLRVGEWRALFLRDEASRVVTVLSVRPRGGAYRP